MSRLLLRYRVSQTILITDSAINNTLAKPSPPLRGTLYVAYSRTCHFSFLFGVASLPWIGYVIFCEFALNNARSEPVLALNTCYREYSNPRPETFFRFLAGFQPTDNFQDKEMVFSYTGFVDILGFLCHKQGQGVQALTGTPLPTW